jgi:hypothetical protein
MDDDSNYDLPVTGSIDAADESIILDELQKESQTVSIEGTWVGTLVFEARNNSGTWFAVPAFDLSTKTLINSITSNGQFVIPTAGFTQARVRSSLWTSGTANIFNEGGTTSQIVFALQAGTWTVTSQDNLTAGGVQGVLNLTTANTAYELKVGANRLANRKLVTALSEDAVIYWGYTNSVTVATGSPIFKNQFYSWPMDDAGSIWLVCSSANKDVRITESP